MGIHFSIVFRCHSSNMRIRNQIVAPTSNRDILSKKAQMTRTGIQRNHMAHSQPTLDVVHGSLTGQRRTQYFRIRHYPNEPCGHGPGESDTFGPVQERLPPSPSVIMLWGSAVVSVN